MASFGGKTGSNGRDDRYRPCGFAGVNPENMVAAVRATAARADRVEAGTVACVDGTPVGTAPGRSIRRCRPSETRMSTPSTARSTF